jgi:hypothetical protein
MILHQDVSGKTLLQTTHASDLFGARKVINNATREARI